MAALIVANLARKRRALSEADAKGAPSSRESSSSSPAELGDLLFTDQTEFGVRVTRPELTP